MRLYKQTGQEQRNRQIQTNQVFYLLFRTGFQRSFLKQTRRMNQNIDWTVFLSVLKQPADLLCILKVRLKCKGPSPAAADALNKLVCQPVLTMILAEALDPLLGQRFRQKPPDFSGRTGNKRRFSSQIHFLHSSLSGFTHQEI